MDVLRTKLDGSTVMEVIVASAIFMLVFFMAMDILPRIGSMVPDGTLLRMEVDMKACIHEFVSGGYDGEEHIRTYDWGQISVAVKPYDRLEELRDMTFTAETGNGKNTYVYRILAP